MTFRPLIFVFGCAAAITTVAGCASDTSGDGENTGTTVETTANDLMVTSGSFTADVTVFPDHLELPRSGYETASADLHIGRLLVGAPGDAKNPHGFLRRSRGVRIVNDKLFIDTDRVQLTDVIQGGAIHADTAHPTLTADDSSGVRPETWTQAAGGSLSFPQTLLLGVVGHFVDPVRSNETFNVKMSLANGGATFTPHVTTDLGISHGTLEHMQLSASGKLDAHVELDLSAMPQGNLTTTEGGLMQPLHFETRIVQFPSVHAMQFVGVVPVWESVETAIVLRCDLALNGSVNAKVSVHTVVDGTFGAAYAENAGWSPVLSGPNFDASGTSLSVQQTGTADVKCSLEPQVALMVFDFAGPTLAIGPYADVHLDEANRNWSIQPGICADVGVLVEFAKYPLVTERVSIFDAPIGTPFTGKL